MWLGERRGNLVDWSAQRWVEATGRRIELAANPWLAGPVGSTRGIGLAFFDTWARANRLEVDRRTPGAGLLHSFAALAGPTFDPAAVAPAVADFYERTADYEVDVWAEWAGGFRPFGFLVSALFGRRWQQLDLPLSPLDTSWGMTSELARVTDRATGEVRASAWVRTLVKTGQPVYVGTYSIDTPPGVPGPCVKAVYPLPDGNAVVLLHPEARPDGSLVLASDGKRFGDPGVYLTVHRPDGGVTARHLRGFSERIHVYPADARNVRADHTMTLYGLRCLHLHYRLRRRPG